MSIARDEERARLKRERQQFWYGLPVSDRAASICRDMTIADVLALGEKGLLRPGIGLVTVAELMEATDYLLEERQPR
jgi:hypothetical protein